MAANPITELVIVGGGAAGWMAAAVLAKAFGRAIRITLVESNAIGTVGVGEATIPQIRHVNRFLGFDEDDFVRRTQASFKLGVQLNDWGRLGDSYLHAFGDIGLPLGFLPFHHYLLRLRHGGGGDDLWTYSINAAAAHEDRFARLERVGDTRLSGIKYAFHFDANLYADYLRSFAIGRDVRRIEGKVVDVALEEPDGFIGSLKLENGAEVSGDFFIDCSGFRGLLIEQALKTGYEDWSHWLPCDRAVSIASEIPQGPVRPYTQATALEAGWRWRIPLQHRIGNGHVYCSRFLSDDEAASTLLEHLDGAALTEPRMLRFTTGMRRKQWNRNCVALGLASGFIEPLESTTIHLIQTGIDRLISLFPDRRFDPAVIDEYNRQSRFEMERIRDFIILHYHANSRTDSLFWAERREEPVPAALKQKIDLFRATGRIYREHEELFTETGWLQVMLGQGIEPESYHPLADALDKQDLAGFVGDVKTLVSRAAESLPSHAAFIRENCASRA